MVRIAILTFIVGLYELNVFDMFRLQNSDNE